MKPGPEASVAKVGLLSIAEMAVMEGLEVVAAAVHTAGLV
jgi:hypothetical protein